MTDKFPRGSLKAATAAVISAASDFGHGGLIAGDAETLARAALTAAMPVIERAVLREAAKRILLLDAIQRNAICPRCHAKTVSRPRTHLSAEPYRCAGGHEWPHPPNRGPYNDADSSVRRLARGEPLPDLPPKEEPRA